MSPENLDLLKNSFPANATSTVVTESNFIEYVAAEAYPPKTIDELRNVTRYEYPQYHSRVKTYFSNKILNQGELDILREICARIPKGVYLYIDSWGGVLTDVSRNASAFVHRDALFLLHVSLRTDEPSADVWMNDFDEIARFILEPTEAFQALIDGDLEDYQGKYYAENIARLVDIKRRFDPFNYFSFPQSIPVT
jgi:hypothetical protein